MHVPKNLIATLSLLLALLYSGLATAEPVPLSHAGLTLNGNLTLAPGKRLQDGVILMVHGTLGHGGMEIMQTLQELFGEKGLNTLAITLSLGLNERQGMYNCNVPHRHQHTDALDEIGAWHAWLKGQGARKITLLGHSRGGNQVAWYATERKADIDRLILIAPLTWSDTEAAADYERRYRTPLKVVLDKAQALVKSGQGSEFLTYQNFLYCGNATVMAQSFVSYYAPESRLDTLTLLPKIKQRVLIFAGTQDEVAPNLNKKVVSDKRVKLVVLDGADHSFRDLYAMELADHVAEFISKE